MPGQSPLVPSNMAKKSSSSSSPPFANVILLGSSGVGKTSIVRLLQNIDPGDALKTTSTIGSELVSVDYKDPGRDGRVLLRILFWDTGGQERFAPLVNAYYRGADAAIAVYDLTDARTLDDLRRRWLPDLRKLAARGAHLPILLIGNKRDLLEHKEKPRPRAVTHAMVEQLAADFGISVAAEAGLLVETSAKDWRLLYDESTPTPIDFFVMRHVRPCARVAQPNAGSGNPMSNLPLVVRDGRGNPLMTRALVSDGGGEEESAEEEGGVKKKKEDSCALGSCGK